MCEMQELKKRAIVLDTAALIAGTDSLFSLGGIVDPSNDEHVCPPDSGEQVTFYTTPDVVNEVRDKRARMRLTILQSVLIVRAPSSEALAAVSSFAKATGDYHVLSLTDLRVMALCWMLEVERDGGSYIREEPERKSPSQFRVGRLIPFAEIDRMEREAAEAEAAAREADDGWISVQKSSRRGSRRQARPVKSKRPPSALPKESKCPEHSASDKIKSQSEDGGPEFQKQTCMEDGSSLKVTSSESKQNANLEFRPEDAKPDISATQGFLNPVPAERMPLKNDVVNNQHMQGSGGEEQYQRSHVLNQCSDQDIESQNRCDGDHIVKDFSSLELRDKISAPEDALQQSNQFAKEQNTPCGEPIKKTAEGHRGESKSDVNSEKLSSLPGFDPVLVSNVNSVEFDVGGVDCPGNHGEHSTTSCTRSSDHLQGFGESVPPGRKIPEPKNTDMKAVYSFDGNYSSDEESGWINTSNIEEHLVQHSKAGPSSAVNDPRVGCVTTDFAMQNTMLQMGLKILTVDGRRAIQRIKHFALRCSACGTVTRELGTKFCDSCGNAAMHRVSFNVNKKGVARVYINPKKTVNIRGTKYPIPKPRGGRHNKDLILRADQVDIAKQRRTEKRLESQNVDVLDPTTFYNAGAKFSPHDRPMIVGYGRRNPNEVRRSTRKKR